MMIWIPDQTGRFRKRPYFLLDALDRRCERVIEQFTVSLYGHFTTPVPTGGLIKLLEKYAADVNLYADLSREGEGVEGVTVFLTGKRPTVRIARELYLDPIRSHRCRYALAHEYGHVYLHAPAWRRRWMNN
jgi:hypothetical protein